MAITKTIIIDDKEVTFKASAAVPRLYRLKFRRDVIKDIAALDKALKSAQKAQEEANKEGIEYISEIPFEMLEIFENVSYIMAKHADPTIPDIDAWFEQFGTFSIYAVLPEILDLWAMNATTLSESKKK